MPNPLAGIAKAVRSMGKGAAASGPKLPNVPISIPGGPERAIIPSVPAAVEAPALPQPSPAELAAKEAATRTGADILSQTVTQEGPHQGLQDLASGEIAREVTAVRSDTDATTPVEVQRDTTLSDEEVKKLAKDARTFVRTHEPIRMTTKIGDVDAKIEAPYVPRALMDKREEIPVDVGRRFDAHGVAKSGEGDQLRALDSLLTNGPDPDRTLYTTALRLSREDEAAIAGAVGAVGPYTEGGFIAIGKPDVSIADGGIAAVAVNEHFYGAISTLQERFPNVQFIRADEMPQKLSEIAGHQQSGPDVPPSGTGPASGSERHTPTPRGPDTAQSQEIRGTPAEGMDMDPRYDAIKKELEEKWLRNHPGKDLLSYEGQNYRLGHVAPGERDLPTLTSDANKVFRERYSTDAAAYDSKERSRVYEDPKSDPALRQVEDDILLAANSDQRVRDANSTAGIDSHSNIWREVYGRESVNAWDRFILQYPDKAREYAQKGHGQIQEALTRREQIQQIQAEQASRQAQSPDAPVSQEPGVSGAEAGSSPDRTQQANAQTEPQAAQTAAQGEEPTGKPETAVRKELKELDIKPETFDKLIELSERNREGAQDAASEFVTLCQQKALKDGKPYNTQEFVDEAKSLFYKLKATHFVDSGMPDRYANEKKLQKKIEKELAKQEKNAKLVGREGLTAEEIRLATIKALQEYMWEKDFPKKKGKLGTALWFVGIILSEIDGFFKGMIPQPQH